MRELAHKMMNLSTRDSASGAPTVIMGTAGTLSRGLQVTPEFRIGMWPCVSAQEPEVAMGLMTTLAYLLERWQGIRVYRVFARLEGEPNSYVWTLDKSQFAVDDWIIEPLDDNVGIWGNLTVEEGRWKLSLEIEDDLDGEDDDESTFTYDIDASSLSDLINKLPQAAEGIAAELGTDLERIRSGVYQPAERDEAQLRSVIIQMFYFERGLLLWLWGKSVDIRGFHQQMLDAVITADDFASWAVGQTTARALLPSFADLREELIPVEDVIEALPAAHHAAVILGRALYGAGEGERGINLIEAALGDESSDPDAWLTLATLYRASGKMTDAVDAFQRAIEADAVSHQLYFAYGTLLPLLDAQGYEISSYILINPEEIGDDRLLWEAVEAHEEALKLNPTNPAPILSRELLLLIELDADLDRLWNGFERLVAQDTDGESVRAVVDEFYNLEDQQPGITILRNAVRAQPENVHLLVNLGAAYIAGDQGDLAVKTLEKALDLTADHDRSTIAEIERLLLAAEDPEFEMTIGEIIDKTEAQNSLTDDEIEFLEDVVEKAPSYVEGYMLLARGHLLADDAGAALEVLLDAEKHNALDPDIVTLLAQVLWESDQQELAFNYLNRAVEATPTHVPLLALTGQYLFEDDQLDEAKAYMARAEAISPNHPALVKARNYIARRIGDLE